MTALRRLALSLTLASIACSGEAAPARASAGRSAPKPGGPETISVPPDSPMLEQVRVEPVTTHELPVDEVVSPAKLEIDPSRRSQVLMPVPGRIVAVEVKVGDRVKAGDVLVTLDSPDADAAIADHRQADADVVAAMAELTKAERDLERVRDLFEHDAVARKEVINAEAAHAEAQAELTRAQAERQQSSRHLRLLGIGAGKTEQVIGVTAPLDGKVLELGVAPNEYRTDTATPLMTIADLSTLLVSANVAENAIRLIAIGEPVEIELVAFPGESLTAKVVRIADIVDPHTRTIEVHAELPNPEGRFRPDMFGKVKHHHAESAVAAVPVTAVVQRDDRDVVVVERSVGEYEVRPVATGARAGGFVAITRGVEVGERVVVDGAFLLIPQ